MHLVQELNFGTVYFLDHRKEDDFYVKRYLHIFTCHVFQNFLCLWLLHLNSVDPIVMYTTY